MNVGVAVFLLRTVRHSSGTERLRATPASSVVPDERRAWAAVVAFTAVHSNNILLQAVDANYTLPPGGSKARNEPSGRGMSIREGHD